MRSPKSIISLLPLTPLLFAPAQSRAQGIFQNLDFESAIPTGYAPNSSDVPVSVVLPGWSAYYGTNQASLVWDDGISIGGAIISVVDTNVAFSFFNPLQGKYSAYLFGGGSGPLVSSTISQTGVVPAGTLSLSFDAYVSGAPFVVTLGGQTINMVPLQILPNYTVYGGNTPPSFAGQSETLSFTEPPATGGLPQPSMFELDNIQFSVNSIPEPGTCALILCGTVVFGVNRWRKRYAISKCKI